jgi:hypothetical protein
MGSAFFLPLGPPVLEGPSLVIFRTSHGVRGRCGFRNCDKHDLHTKPRILEVINGWGGVIGVDVNVLRK